MAGGYIIAIETFLDHEQSIVEAKITISTIKVHTRRRMKIRRGLSRLINNSKMTYYQRCWGVVPLIQQMFGFFDKSPTFLSLSLFFTLYFCHAEMLRRHARLFYFHLFEPVFDRIVDGHFIAKHFLNRYACRKCC